MRVAHIICDLKSGGAQKSAVDIINASEGSVENYLILLENKRFYEPQNIKTYSLCENIRPFKKLDFLGDILLAKRLKKLLHELKIDIAISHMEVVAKVLHEVDIPKVYFIRSNLVNEFERLKKRSFVRYLKRSFIHKKILRNQHLFCVSKDLAKISKEYFKPKSIETIYTPFDFEKIYQLCKEKTEKIPDNYIVYIGGNRKEKRFDILLDAFAKLKDKNIKLLTLGTKVNAPHELKHRIISLEFKPNPYPYIKNAKLLVLSSEQEGLPRVIVEALSMKTPVVATDCDCGPREILTGEFSSFLARVNDREDLSLKIDNALKHYPKIPDLLLCEFSKEQILKTYISSLTKILG